MNWDFKDKINIDVWEDTLKIRVFLYVVWRMEKYMVGINVYDEKKIDTSSDDFKIKIANSVKEMVLRDWDKIVNLEEYQDENTKNFHVDVKIEIE